MEHLEGRQAILAALRARQRQFQVILIRHGVHIEMMQDVLKLAEQMNIPTRFAAAAEIDALAHSSSHGGLIAIVSPKRRANIDELLEHLDRLTEPPLLLLLEGIEDGRNLGFVLRSASAMGCHAVLIKKHLWDFDSVEISRASSGAFESLPLVQIDDAAPLQMLQRRGVRLLGCLVGVKQTIFQEDLTRPIVLAIGGEKRGLSGAVRSICDGFVRIPTRPDAPSLSLSHAAAIVMAEAMRQRSARHC